MGSRLEEQFSLIKQRELLDKWLKEFRNVDVASSLLQQDEEQIRKINKEIDEFDRSVTKLESDLRITISKVKTQEQHWKTLTKPQLENQLKTLEDVTNKVASIDSEFIEI